MKKIFLILLLLFGISGCAKLNTDPSISSDEETPFVASEKQLVAHFLDVGQADANVIELPNGELMLIDAGLSGSSEEIIQYIQDLGYDEIDYVVATHPHADHIGGMAEVIDAFQIGNIYMPRAVSTSKTYENLLEVIQDKGLTIKTGKIGVKVLEEEDLSIEMFAPVGDDYSNLNNYSIVLKIIYGDVSFLYTGDAEEENLEKITGDIEADVLKVGHHGSDTSTSKDFLEKVQPEYAIISVGEGNSYGHPASSTIELLKEYTNHIYLTNENGTVVVSTDGVNIDVETER